MDVNIFDLMELQKFGYLVYFWFETLELNLAGGEHELSSQPPGGALAGPVNQFVGIGIFALIIIHQVLGDLGLQRFLHLSIVAQRFYFIFEFLFYDILAS